MKPCSPFRIHDQWEEPLLSLRNPLDDGRFFIVRDGRIDAAVDNEVSMNFETGRLQGSNIEASSLCDLLIGIMENVDFIGSARPILVEDQTASDIAAFRAVFARLCKIVF